MDPDDEEDKALLWIAREALYAPVPEPWVEGKDLRGHLYYQNEVTHQTLREHPLDEYYRQLYYQKKGKWDKAYWTPGETAQQEDASHRQRETFDYYTQSGYYSNTLDMAEAFDLGDLPAMPAGVDAMDSAAELLPDALLGRLVVDEARFVATKDGPRASELPVPMSPFGRSYGANGLRGVLLNPAGRHAMVQCYVLREKDSKGARPPRAPA